LHTRYHATDILQTEHIAGADYLKNNETVGHNISLCPILATKQHLKRYDIKPVINYTLPYARI
jgi:hypothetical protein